MQFLTTLTALAALLPITFAAPTGNTTSAEDHNPLADSYIVVLKPETDFDEHQAWLTHAHSSRLSRRSDPRLTGFDSRYTFGAYNAYTGHFDSSTIDELRLHPSVDFVEPNLPMRAFDVQTQYNAPSWGLPRISQSKIPSNTDYYYDSSAGDGITVYVVDTGINIHHSDFGGRATWGFNNVDQTDTDLNGHGTHVAGTVGGSTYGVAKNADLVAVKVLDKSGSGTNANIIDGIQWVVSDARKRGRTGKSVANMSLGGAYSAAVNKAVEAAAAAGVTFVVAAGNDNVDASNTSPASAGSAITVGATDRKDTRSTFSNYGRFVDVWAPGTDILSTWIGGDSATKVESGTSMACPHVAGLAATIMSADGVSGAKAVTEKIFRLALANKAQVNGAQSTSNWLVYNGSGN